MTAGEVPLSTHDRCGCPDCCVAANAALAPSPDWPMDVSNGRLLCTPERPRPADAKGRWAHRDIENTHAGDYTDDWRCKACGVEWAEELAE
jgi:hypothetical protein